MSIEEIKNLFFDDEDFEGAVYWYNDALEQIKEINNVSNSSNKIHGDR